MMDAMKVAAALRRAAENAGCGLHEVVSGGVECPEGSCNGCREVSAAWANEAADAIERRALPDGVEWPRFEDGEPVRLDSMILDRVTGEPYEAKIVTFNKSDDETISVHVGGGAYEMGERLKRPPVIAADGEPLEVGQTVYGTRDLEPVEIVSLRSKEYDGVRTVKCKDRTGFVFYAPDDLTHQRPVLDADGVPIKVGDTVWEVGTVLAIPMTVVEVSRDTVRCECAWTDGKVYRPRYLPSALTHTKPEPPDKACEDCAYFAKDPNAGTMGVCFAKTVRYGSNKFAYKFTCRWNPTCEKYEERGER